ncbi:TetR-like C-terminal domain-containing protein [Luethyella okanaganae]|uniref:TetR-like C-terminal domain-containing protein n=1 Tax=Luethyella okanaganae TaxID=69372 RepID=A0ABW1VH18_9MICO
MTNNQVGRPLVPGIKEALIQAAERIMATEGFSGLTVDGLVMEVGTTRPTFYRRYSNVAHLAFEVIEARFGTGTPVNTGSLYGDLLKLQREDIAMFASPLLRNNLPGLLESVRTDLTVRERYRDEFIGPRRANVAKVIAAAVERGELADRRVDIDIACDLLVGPILARTLLPLAVAVDDRLARQTAQVVLDYLRSAVAVEKIGA